MNKESIITTVKSKEDALLVEKASQGDRQAFNKLILKYQDRVYSICFKITGDYDTANDCAQETFIKVFKKLKSFKGKSKFSTWLYSVTVNTCKNYITSSYYKKEYSTINIVKDKNNQQIGEFEVTDNRYDPEKEILADEVEEKIKGAVLQLPVDLRIIVIMKDMEGRTYEEVANILSMKEGTVKSKLARARNQLRKMLQDIAL